MKGKFLIFRRFVGKLKLKLRLNFIFRKLLSFLSMHTIQYYMFSKTVKSQFVVALKAEAQTN